MAELVGFLSGLLIILSIGILKRIDKPTIYGLTLAGIGFLYTGFTWSDTTALFINSIQALLFLLFAYYGIENGLYFLAAGYFLHGIWDLLYPIFSDLSLIPPHYPLFCFSLDWTIGVYLLFLKYKHDRKVSFRF